MEKNVGTVDKIIRSVLALGFVVLGLKFSYWWFIGTAVLIFTVITGHCLPYTWLGINTNKKK